MISASDSLHLTSNRVGSATLPRLGLSLRFEGRLEEGLVRLLDLHPHVLAVRRATSLDVYLPDGSRHAYACAFEVDLADGRSLSLACSPHGLLRSLLHGHEAAWQARATVLEAAGRPLQLVTERDLPPGQLAQADAFGHFHGVAANSAVQSQVLTLLQARGLLPYVTLRQHLLAGGHTPVSVDATLHGMIARRKVLLDPDRPLHETLVDLPGQAIPMPLPPLGTPLRALLADLPSLPAPAPSAEPDPLLRLEAKFLQSAPGQRALALFSRYPDPTVRLSEAEASRLAQEVGVSPRTVYRFRKSLVGAGAPGVTFRELVPHLATGERQRPSRQVTPEVAQLIERLASEAYFRPVGSAGRARGISDLHRLVRQACQAEDLPPPARTTVKRHVERHVRRDPIRATQAREGRERSQALEARQGQLAVTRYGALWGIDCSPCDVFTLDGELQLSLQTSGRGPRQRRPDATRGNIVTVVDVATSQVLRSALFGGGVGAAQILQVLRSLMLGDTRDLSAAGVTTLPQAAGLPRQIRMDAGTEFVNRQVTRVLAELGIEVVARNKWSRHHGGIEERTIGTLTHSHHVLPGTSMNNTSARGEYRAQRGARLTLADLDRFHQRVVQDYNSLCAPLSALSRQDHAAQLMASGQNALRPLSPSQREYVQERLQPQETRVCQRGGISLHGLMYTAPALAPLIVRRAEVPVTWNPDDISTAQAVDPDTGELILIRARLPQGLEAPLSLKEWDELRSQLRSAQEAARDRARTPQQLLQEVMRERERQSAQRSTKMQSRRSLHERALRPALQEEGASAPRIRAAEIEFEENAPLDLDV